MVPPNENPARTGGGIREKSALVGEADRKKSKSERSYPQAPYFDRAAETLGLAEQALAQIQLDWGEPSQQELDWFRRQGVTEDALVQPWPIGATSVLFDGHNFAPDPNGVRAITIVVIDCGYIIDIAAWQPRSGQVASWLGKAFCIDQDQLTNPATYFADGALLVHRTPLEWLRAGRDGIVILRPELSYIYLGRCRRLWVSDSQLGVKVRRWLQPPKPKVQISVANTKRVV
jgi:hypothetical protein